MAFVPKDPTANEPIGSFTVNIFDLALHGKVTYIAPFDENGAAISFEFEAADDIKKVVAAILDADISMISITPDSYDEIAEIRISQGR